MLKFWKKTSGKEKSSDSGGSSPLSTPWGISPTASTGYLTLDVAVEEITKLPTDKPFTADYSRLSKPLVHLLNDSEALGYFLQYLETVNAVTLAKCLMDLDHYTACFTNGSSVVDWYDVKGVNQVTCDATGKKRWEFGNGVSYTSALACDISRKCEAHAKAGISDCGCERTRFLAVSRAKLAEMEAIEDECLTEILQTESVSEVTLDALRIFYKYFSCRAPYKIILDISVFRRLVEQLRRNISLKNFSEVRDVIFGVLDKEFYNDYVRSEFHCKYQMTVLTGTKVQIADIIYNEAALFYFTEYLEQEGHRGLLEFWIAANHFKELYQTSTSYDPTLAQTDAMVLYDKYFSLQATQPLHLGDKVRFMVEESICQERGPLPTCFEHVQDLIVRLLEVKFLASFLQSQLYFNFLSELISTASAGPVSRTGGSDCSSEVSISVTNTLLASDDSVHRRRIFRNWDSGSLNIDSRQLNDPDSLWRRGKQNGLAFGRVNSLGRFETDMEPEPDRKQGLESRITKAMKKFVNLEEDKSKEEMAWQVAEMIVKDVTNLTMPPTNP